MANNVEPKRNNSDEFTIETCMPEHGDHNSKLQRWYCSYWMTAQEWEDIHDYIALHPTGENMEVTYDNKDLWDHAEDIKEEHSEKH